VVAFARDAIQDRLTHSLPVAAIHPSPRNPRQRMDSIAELAESLGAHGLLQPVVVRRRGAGYEVIAGHRRLEAARVLGWNEIAAVVRDETDDQAYILTLVENLQREDLSPKEEAAALEVLVRERGWSTRQVGEAVKRSAMYVSRRLRVFEDPVLAPRVLAEQLSVSTAEELLRVAPEQREDLAQQAVSQHWERPQVRAVLRERNAALQQQPAPRLASRIRALREELAGLEAGTLPAQAKRELANLVELGRLLTTTGCPGCLVDQVCRSLVRRTALRLTAHTLEQLFQRMPETESLHPVRNDLTRRASQGRFRGIYPRFRSAWGLYGVRHQ
jgi:ParB family transcriptional regulator, chromosome partitioning protein